MNTFSRIKGFTLIELMVVVVIIGILSAIAIPAYNNQVRKANRADAMTALTQVQLEQEKLRANCRFYGGAIAGSTACNSTAAASTVGYSTGAANSPEEHYTITISTDASEVASGNRFVALATAASTSQLADTQCREFKLTVSTSSPNGTMSSEDSGGNDSTSTCIP